MKNRITASGVGNPNSYRYHQDGWCIIHLEGTPYERGRAYGYLIINEINDIDKILKETIPIFYGHSWKYFVEKSREIYGTYIIGELKEELEGIVAGLQTVGSNWGFWEVFAWNCQISILDYWWRIDQKGLSNNSEGSSSFIATGSATSNGEIVLAHNTWDNYYRGSSVNCILEIVPPRGNQMIMQTYYGVIVGLTDFFVTSAGIIGSDTTITGFNVWKPGCPCFIRLRLALQYATNLEGFVEILLKDNGGDYANTWYLGDINTNEIMKLDIGYQYHSIKKKVSGYFIGFNESENHQIRNLECKSSSIFNIKTSGGARRVRLNQLMEEHYGSIDVNSAQKILSDNYDIYTNMWGNNQRSIEARYDMDSDGTLDHPPNCPYGALDGKVVTSNLAKEMSFWARWGSSSGLEFKRDGFCQKNPQWKFLYNYLKDRPTQPWSMIKI